MKKLALLILVALPYSQVLANSHQRASADVDTPLPMLESLAKDAALTLTPPDMTRFLVEGVPVIFTRVNELPILDITMTFKGGSAKDTSIRADGHGIANMTATMVSQGTTSLDELAFAEQAELLGAVFGASASQDIFEYSFRSLSDDKTLTPALVLFADMMANPRFDKDILKRNQAQADIIFERAKQDPDHLAHRAFLQALYGKHPYSTPTFGTQKGVSSLSVQDLIHYKNTYLTKENAHLAITGDISEDKARQIAKRLIDTLPTGNKASSLPTPITPKPVHIHIPYDSTQTHIHIGHLGEKDTKDTAELQARTNFNIASSVLAGGDFNARLMKQIRVQHGYTYGITGSMSVFEERGYYRISFSTQADHAKDAILKTLEVINDTRHQGITEAEFELERTSRKHAYPMSLATNSAIHRTASNLNYKNLPNSHIQDYLTRLQNANTAHANQALTKYLRPNEFIIITVGKQKPDLSEVFNKTTPPRK